MNKTIKKTVLLSLWVGSTLCSLANASEGFETMREQAQKEAEIASARLCSIDDQIQQRFESVIETERLQHKQETEALKSIITRYKDEIDRLQNKKNRIVNIQKQEIIQHGETQESCNMQADIEELNAQIIELTEQYGAQIEKLQTQVRLERSSANYYTNEYAKLKSQLAQATGLSNEEAYGYADYLLHPAVVGTATTITTAIVSYIVYQYAIARRVDVNNAPPNNAVNALAGLAGLGIAEILEDIGEGEAAKALNNAAEAYLNDLGL